MTDAQDFLNPNSMLTPGIAGGLTVSISLPLAVNFAISFKWIALIMSFVFGIIIILQIANSQSMSKTLCLLYCIINSLIIFSVSIGAGAVADPPPKPPSFIQSGNLEYEEFSRTVTDLFLNTINIASALAQDVNEETAPSQKSVDKMGVKIRELEERIQQLEKGTDTSNREQQLRAYTKKLKAYDKR
jgi:hypothetical protein